MYELKKSFLIPKEPGNRNREYLIDILRRLGAFETEESFLLPNEVLTPLKPANISEDIYDYFQLVWSNEECLIPLEDIIGSHDIRNLDLKTWLQNFLIKDVGRFTLEKYLISPKVIYDSKEHPLSVFEIDKKYYIADGHHRFSTLYLHYHILKSQNKLPADFPITIKGIKRVVPTNTEFIKNFIKFCIDNHLYYEDEHGIISYFEVVDSSPDNPIIRYSESNIVIDQNSDFNEVLEKIKEVKLRKK